MIRHRSAAVLSAFAIVLALAAGRPAHAAFGDFSITTVIVTPAGGSVTDPSGNSTVNLLGPSTSPSPGNAAAPGTNIGFAQVQLADNGVSTSYTNTYTIPYEMDVTLKDTDSTATGVFKIFGTLSGSITDLSGTFSSLFNNSYTTGAQSLVIGGTQYTVTVANLAGFFTNPSPPSGPGGVSSQNGTFAMNVLASTPSTTVPEPTSMALLAVGGLMATALLRRRRVALS